jgi:DNA-binding MarR family transcriptional regulator
MTLLSEIKQTKPFSSKKQQAIVNILYTANWIYAVQHNFLKVYDISFQQYNVLRILNGQDGNPITVNDIIERMLDKTSNASRLVDKLVNKGLVLRTQKEGNRRACDVRISNEGQDFLNEITKNMIAFESELGNLNESEFEELNRLLDKIRKSE